jgi:hypothetical protein
MSTASLHCGIVCCARGFWCHAPKGSGVSGATRAHYDARALEWAVGSFLVLFWLASRRRKAGPKPQTKCPKSCSRGREQAPFRRTRAF